MEDNQKKKSKKGLVIGIIVGVVLLLFILLLFGGDDVDDVAEDTMVEEYADRIEDSVEDAVEGEYGDFMKEPNERDDYDFKDLSDSREFPCGTCEELDDTTVVVSIFASDDTTSWDFDKEEDVKMYNDMSTRMRLGLDWIEEQSVKYHENAKFVSDFMADEDLFYTVKLDCNFGDGQSHIDVVKPFLEENMNEIGVKLLKKYDADNILFAFFLNEPEDTAMVSYAHPFYGTHRGFDMPYEAVVYSSYVYGAQQGPAMYAHEVLHCFGAPDLYYPDTDGGNFGLTQEFVDYCKANHENEIMFSNYDVINNCVNYEKVTNDLTDLTAYYLGWVDNCQELSDFGLGEREDK